MNETIETTTSVTVIHGAMLSFEWIGAATASDAPLRVIEGTVVLEIEGTERTLTIEHEARIEAGIAHRLWKAGTGEARIVQELRRR
jgi:hypothetical protein